MIIETVEDLEDLLQQAARIEAMLPDFDRQKLKIKGSWPDYLYDLDDRKDQEPEKMRLSATAKQLDILDDGLKYLNFLGIRNNNRTIYGKKIIWARAKGISYRKIAYIAGIPPKTCEYWYKKDLEFILKKINSI
jgi:hypothetical protein